MRNAIEAATGKEQSLLSDLAEKESDHLFHIDKHLNELVYFSSNLLNQFVHVPMIYLFIVILIYYLIGTLCSYIIFSLIVSDMMFFLFFPTFC